MMNWELAIFIGKVQQHLWEFGIVQQPEAITLTG
jgi:hypothetical protein